MIRNILGWKHGELGSGPGPATASQLCNSLGHLLCNWDMNQFIRSKGHVCGYHHPSIFQLVIEKMHRNQSAGATVQRKTPHLVRCPAEVKSPLFPINRPSSGSQTKTGLPSWYCLTPLISSLQGSLLVSLISNLTGFSPIPSPQKNE